MQYPPNASWEIHYTFKPMPHRLVIEHVERSMMIPPVRTKMVMPKFPRARVQGIFKIEFTVTADGRTRDIHVTQSPHRLFEPYMIKAVEQWRYNPANINGRAVDCPAEIEFPFDINYYDMSEPLYMDTGPSAY